MSETKNLKLFKHDDPPNNTNQFDVDKSLNKNWDKIDDFATKTDESVIDLEEKYREVNEENKKLREDINNSLPSGQATGENITINDSAEARFKEFNIKGNSYQETREHGKNYWNNDNIETKTIVEKLDTGFKITRTEETRFGSKYDMKIPAGSYKIICKENTNATSNLSGMTFYYADGDTHTYAYNSNPTFPSDVIAVQPYIGSTESVGTFYELTDLMIISSTEEDETYEPYQPFMPSLEAPSEIRNCGDNVNLFDGVFRQGSWNDTSSLTRCQSTQELNLALGDYTLSTNLDMTKYKLAVLLLKEKTPDKSNSIIKSYGWTTTQEKEINIESKGFLGVSIAKNNTNEEISIEEINSIQDLWFKLEKGSVATPYSLYNCGNINFKIENKNLIDINKFESSAITSRNNTSITANFTGNFQSAGTVDIPLSNKKYLASIELSPSNTSARIELRLGKNGKTVVTKTMYTTYLIDNSNGEYDSVGITLSNGTYIGELTFNKPQLEVVKEDNSIPTEYILHQEQNISFPTKEGQVFHKGDYLAADGVHQTQNQTKLTGNEHYQYFSVDDAGNGNAFIFDLPVVNMDYTKDVYCNMLSKRDSQGIKPYTWNITPGNKGFSIKLDNTVKDANDIKNFVKTKYDEGNPFIIQYHLLDEIIEPYSEEQQEVYDQIKNIKSYKNTTNIYSEDEVSPVFEVEYIKDLETLITKG